MEKKVVDLVLSRGKQIPCLWEQGGGYTSTGEAILLADKEGNAPQAIYIRRKGQLACNKHALIPIKIGMLYISFYHHRQDFSIKIYQITEIDIEKNLVYMDLLYSFDEGVWVPELPDYLKTVVEKGIKKATTYHCRGPYYCIEPTYKIC